MATAQTDDLPQLADGKVDIDAVLSSFKAVRRTGTAIDPNHVEGEILGVAFIATFAPTTPPDPFLLTIRASGLSLDAAYLTAILLTDIICLSQNRGAAPVNWDTSAQVATGWQVTSACSTSPRLPNPTDSNAP